MNACYCLPYAGLMAETCRSASKQRAIHTHTFTVIIRKRVSQINNNKN